MSKWDLEEEVEIEYGDFMAKMIVHYWGYEIPAKLTGHPDHMYPGEGEDEMDLIGLILEDEEGVETEITDKARIDEVWKAVRDEVETELRNRLDL